MTLRLSYEKVKEILSTEGYELLSTSYKNSATKIKILCPNGHIWDVALNNFTSAGQRCPFCLDKAIYATEKVKEILLKEGYVLITPTYENMKQKLDMLCPKNHKCKIPLWSFVKTNSRCLICSNINRYSTKDVVEIFKKEGYILLTKEYKNARQKLLIICPNDHKTNTMTLNGFMSAKTRCRLCAKNKNYTLKGIKDFVESRNYKLISKNYTPTENICLECPKGHVYNTSTFYNFKRGRNCPECTLHGSSIPEKEIKEWINQFYPKAKKEVLFYDPKNKKKRLELDIYIPEIKLAIEYNGLIWHSDKYRDKNYHYEKTKSSNGLGIRMIHIFGDEWDDRKDQIKNYLLSVMNKNSISLGARKTGLKRVNTEQAKIFLENNHIQGSGKIEVSFGLYVGDELMAIITGNRHHRQNQEKYFILNRLAFKSNVSVQGGASKLLKALISYAKENGYQKLISWSDNRWSEGKVYEKMGFSLEEEMLPDYSYIKRDLRFSKQSCQKKNLIKKGAIGTMANTEKELALSLGLYRIWDCGKKRWSIDLTK